MFTYSENFMFLAKVDKKFEFWRTRLGGTPIMAPPTLCLIPTHSENFVYLAPTIQTYKILDDLFEGDPPTWHP